MIVGARLNRNDRYGEVLGCGDLIAEKRMGGCGGAAMLELLGRLLRDLLPGGGESIDDVLHGCSRSARRRSACGKRKQREREEHGGHDLLHRVSLQKGYSPIHTHFAMLSRTGRLPTRETVT